MKKLENKVMLITYSDSMGHNLKDLEKILSEYFRDAVGGVHILPFFPSSGDRGFAPMDYTKVDPAFGGWENVERLADKYYLMFDYMINHISAQSEYYKDFLAKKEDSEYKDLFIRYKDFWEGGEPTQEQVDVIYKRKPRAPYVDAHFADGTTEKVWCTFDEEQIDINCKSETAKKFIRDNLVGMCRHGAAMIRLDAFAYAPKTPGKKNFLNDPETWELLQKIHALAEPLGLTLLPEIHAAYDEKIYETLAEKGYATYDFFLPGLIIDAIENRRGTYLAGWAKEIVEKKISTVNMLGCHDGIPLLDLKGLLPKEDIQSLIDRIVSRGGMVKNLHGQKNLYYQVNATYYSALGESDEKMLLARAIQMFMPGKSQIWYLDLFAGKNDHEAVQRAGESGHKEINRTNLSTDQITEGLKKDVVQKQLALIRMRNTHKAFSEGAEVAISGGERSLEIRWEYNSAFATLYVNFESGTYTIVESK